MKELTYTFFKKIMTFSLTLFVIGNVSIYAQTPCAISPTTQAFTNTTPVAIPAGPAVVSSTLAVAGAGMFISDINITTNITHTFAGDLDIVLISPAGTIVTLTTDNGAGNDNVFNGTLWNDQADPDGIAPYVTNPGLVTDHVYANLVVATPLVPEEPLAAFINENPNGLWTLRVSDDAGGDAGSINSWSLSVTSVPVAVGGTTTVHNHAPNTPIPTGPAVVTSTFNVAGIQNFITNLVVTTNITHTNNADLDITLTSPQGTSVTLTTDNGGTNDNVFNGTVWNNDANPLGDVPYTANQGVVTDHTYTNLVVATPLTPEESLGAFFGQDPNGTWTLTISDDLASNGGIFSSISLSITALTNPTCNITLPIAPLVVSTSPDVCAAVTTIPAPATTGDCAGVAFSYSVDGGPVQNAPGGQATVNLLPGPHTITWFATTPCGTTSGTQSITVQDLTPPVLTCPEDIDFTLDPGACSAFIGYTVTASDNCPFMGPAGTVNSTPGAPNNGNSSGGVVFFDLVNNFTGPMTITGM